MRLAAILRKETTDVRRLRNTSRESIRSESTAILWDDGAATIKIGSLNGDCSPILMPLQEFEAGGSARACADIKRARLSRYASIVILGRAVLRAHVTLPSTAMGRLSEILKFEVERHSPLSNAQIYFDYCMGFRKLEKNISVELRIVRRDYLDTVIRLARLAGLEPVALTIENDSEPFKPSGIALSASAIALVRGRRHSTVALSILAFVLTIGAATALVQRHSLVTASVAERLEDSRLEASAVEKLRKELEDSQKQTVFLEDKKRQSPVIDILTQLTRLVPTDTWIYDFQLNGTHAHIRGFSRAASALLPLFERSALFKDAQFQAPLTQGPQPGLERFDLSFELKGERP